MTTPLTKTARHARIADILAREQVRSQEELAELLERYASVHVTQATLSRDLDELGVVKLRAGGSLVYALPEPLTSTMYLLLMTIWISPFCACTARWLPTRTSLPIAPAIAGLFSTVANCITIAESPVICTSTLSPLALL